MNPERVTQVLRLAAAAVESAELDPSLKIVAFEKAVDLIVGQGAAVQLSGPPAPQQEGTATTALLGVIASKLGLDSEVVGEIFESSDGNVTLTVARSKLAPEKSKGAKQIALLVAAARQGAGIEEWTESKVIREVADDYGKFDSPNFASSIAELGDFFSFSGSGSTKKIKLRRAGYEEAAALIRRLHGGASQ